jgi:hypothetical protein
MFHGAFWEKIHPKVSTTFAINYQYHCIGIIMLCIFESAKDLIFSLELGKKARGREWNPKNAVID